MSGANVVAGVGFKPATLRTEGTELTTEPQRPMAALGLKGTVPLLQFGLYYLAKSGV